jgi:hypothetical protein
LVYIKYKSSGKRVLLPRGMWIYKNDVLINEIKNVLGDENVVLIEKITF